MKLICIKCPKGCEILIDGEKITGNACPRGLDYAREEMTSPKRTLTYLLKTDSGIVPVKSDKEIPKDLLFQAVDKISKLNISNAHIGDIVIENILNTGANIVVTGNIYKA